MASAGPPYFTDDPVPTDLGHYEVYAYADALHDSGGTSSDAGIDLNYGGARDLQLTAVVPFSREQARYSASTRGVGNPELAAKWRFLHHEDVGWDVAVFPRVILASASSAVGEQHVAYQLPLWVERDSAAWSTFGGGGCVLNHGGASRNDCYAGWAITKPLTARTQRGAELRGQRLQDGTRPSAGLQHFRIVRRGAGQQLLDLA